MKNKVVTIPAKMSGTGTIHDIASQHGDREIIFKNNAQYAIVLAAYYGNNIYYLAKDKAEAIEISQREKEYSRVIIDADNNNYYADWEKLYPA